MKHLNRYIAFPISSLDAIAGSGSCVYCYLKEEGHCKKLEIWKYDNVLYITKAVRVIYKQTLPHWVRFKGTLNSEGIYNGQFPPLGRF